MSKVLHIVPGTKDVANGMAVVAKLLAKEQGNAEVMDLDDSMRFLASASKIPAEVWVHGMWLPKEWMACRRVLKSGAKLVRMPHGSLSPLYLKCQSPLKKMLAGPIERRLLGGCSKIVATCEAEKKWIESYLGARHPTVEIADIKRFFHLNRASCATRAKEGELHLLYLGRKHPLKGLGYLEEAVRQMRHSAQSVRLKMVYNVSGDEKEKLWDWCDVLALPSLSENFGLVVAEALERGKCAVATDGASAWEGDSFGGRLVYVRGFLAATESERTRLLRDAISRFL